MALSIQICTCFCLDQTGKFIPQLLFIFVSCIMSIFYAHMNHYTCCVNVLSVEGNKVNKQGKYIFTNSFSSIFTLKTMTLFLKLQFLCQRLHNY